MLSTTDHSRFLRNFFRLAALYNGAWGVWVLLFPRHVFMLAGLPGNNQPWVWQTVGMIVGIYAVGYAWAANHLRDARMIAFIGFLGKCFGIAGWIWKTGTGELNSQSFFITFFNDMIWIPGFLYFFWYTGSRTRPFIFYALIFLLFTHGSACMLSALSVKLNFWYTDHAEKEVLFPALHTVFSWGWMGWAFSSLSFLTFSFSYREGSKNRISFFARVLTLFAVIPDVATNFSLVSFYRPDTFYLFEYWAPLISFGFANTFYTIVLAMILWDSRGQFPSFVNITGWVSVVFGTGLSLCAFPVLREFSLVFSGGLMVAFNLWALCRLVIIYRRGSISNSPSFFKEG